MKKNNILLLADDFKHWLNQFSIYSRSDVDEWFKAARDEEERLIRSSRLVDRAYDFHHQFGDIYDKARPLNNLTF